jgi:hypothetical protein
VKVIEILDQTSESGNYIRKAKKILMMFQLKLKRAVVNENVPPLQTPVLARAQRPPPTKKSFDRKRFNDKNENEIFLAPEHTYHGDNDNAPSGTGHGNAYMDPPIF